MLTFDEFLTESQINEIFMIFRQAYKDKFGDDKNVIIDQNGKLVSIETPKGNFTLVEAGRAFKLKRYNFEGHDDWFIKTITPLLRWGSRR